MNLRRAAPGSARRGRLVGAASVAAMALVLVACQPVGVGNPGAVVGNDLDPVDCPGLQATATAPCGPQPLLWASMNGPFALYANGDPYSTHCVDGGGSGTGCTQGNPLYRTSGYAYVIDVAAADVGTQLTLQGYDVGLYPRTTGAGGASAAFARDVDDLARTAGSRVITSGTANFTGADVGQRISVPSGISSSVTISSVTNATTAQLSANATSTGVGPATIGYDCNTQRPPWNTTVTGLNSSGCQTGDDSDAQNVDVQVFDNDGSGRPSYAVPLAGCHFSHSGAEMAAQRGTYKNTWVDLCTFTPSRQGIYAFRFRNSGIDGMADVGSGNNQYALKLLGGTSTTMHATGDQSIFLNSVGSIARTYLAEVPASNAGKKLIVDLFDPGDGSGSSNYVLQILGPPGGAPSPAPNTGVVLPAPGIATSCMYNATPSASAGPATPEAAASCAVTTHTPNTNVYNGKWLRFEITLDPAYSCSSDCWWTMRWNFGVAGLPTDRVTYTVKVV